VIYYAHLQGDAYTFDSQSAYVLPYQVSNGTTLPIYMGDRWNYAGALYSCEKSIKYLCTVLGPGGLLNATYIWLPVSVTPNASVPGGYQFKMPYRKKWSIWGPRI